MDRNTPNYLIMEETKGEKIRDKALKMAIKYEKARTSKKSLVRECIQERKKERRRK